MSSSKLLVLNLFLIVAAPISVINTSSTLPGSSSGGKGKSKGGSSARANAREEVATAARAREVATVERRGR